MPQGGSVSNVQRGQRVSRTEGVRVLGRVVKRLHVVRQNSVHWLD